MSLALVFVFTTVCVCGASASPSIVLDGKPVAFDAKPVIENSRLLVPLRSVLEALDAEVLWDPETRIVKINKGVNQVVLTIGSSSADCNGQIIDIDAPARIIDGRAMVPLRFLSEAFGLTINWIEFDNDHQIIVLRNPLIAYKTGLLHYTSRHTKWGQSLDEVMASEPFMPVESDKNSLIYSEVDFEGLPSDMAYFFISDELALNMYDLHGEKQLAEESMRVFKRLSGILDRRYGEPVAEVQQWRNGVSLNPDNWPQAVASGDLALLTAWMDEYTMICLYLNDKGENLGIVYADVEMVDNTLISLMKQGLNKSSL